jgi:hypothetical protein
MTDAELIKATWDCYRGPMDLRHGRRWRVAVREPMCAPTRVENADNLLSMKAIEFWCVGTEIHGGFGGTEVVVSSRPFDE